MRIVEDTLLQFQNDLSGLLGDELYEIIVHGSYALGDFLPDRGDLDYTVATLHNLTEDETKGLFSLHDRYRHEKRLVLHQLEGTFYPRKVFADPTTSFAGCYIGTGRQGWRRIDSFQNSWIDLRVMAERGIHLLGRPLDLYRPSHAQLRTEQLRTLTDLRDAVRKSHDPGAGIIYAAIHWCATTMHLIRSGASLQRARHVNGA